jgi:hypothetical protein
VATRHIAKHDIIRSNFFVTKNTHKILLGELNHLHVIVAQNVSCTDEICDKVGTTSSWFVRDNPGLLKCRIISYNRTLSRSVDLTKMKFFNRVSLTKATGAQMDNFCLFLSNVPLIHITHHALLYLRQRHSCCLLEQTYGTSFKLEKVP